MKHSTNNHANHDYTIMFFVMILSGFLSTMNVWADKLDDVRFSLNDVYMTLLMSGWMFLFMGIIYKKISVFAMGVVLIIPTVWCIITQFLITETQYKLGMIPHHSMAVHMSKKLSEKLEKLENGNEMSSFVQNIINTQENEIDFLKKK